MYSFDLSQEDLDNIKNIKLFCASYIDELKKNQEEYNLLSTAKTNACIEELGSSWVSFIDCYIDLLYLVDKGIIKLKNFNVFEGFELGYDDFADVIEGLLQSKSESIESIDELQNDIKYNILSYLTRDVDLDTYLAESLYSRDLKNLIELLNSIEENVEVDGFNKNVLNDIKENNIVSIQNQYSETLSKIKKILRAFYQNTFSLYPYPAVFAFKGVAKKGYGAKAKTISLNTIVVPSNTSSVYQYKPADKSDAIYYDILAKKLQELSGINMISFDVNSELSSRCYNLDDILNCDLNSTIYYPLEAFAFASRALLEQRNDSMYKSSGVNSYDNYENIVDTYIGDLLSKYIYNVMEKYGKTYNEKNIAENISFLSDDFKEAYEEITSQNEKAEVYENYISGIMATLQNELNKFIRCICSAYVISRNDSNDYFKVKVTDFSGRLNAEDTVKLFGDAQFTQNAEGVVFDKAVAVNVCGCTIYEYSFCKDAELMDKKPLFGYTAARLFQKQGKAISVENILLGEDVTGAPLFASKDSPVYLGTKLCHRFNAGSRSGKGVMTMNILASSLASENVVFYIDRKPDIGSCLAKISDGKMFVVDGGDTNSSEDTFHVFSPEHKEGLNMLEKYVSSNKSSYKRNYLTKVFGNDFGDTYASAYGDFVYMKAMILALGIITARIHFTANRDSLIPEGVDDLAINKRVTVVVDEITNWHHMFEHEYFCTDVSSSMLSQSALKRYYNPSLGAELADSSLSEIEGKLSSDEQVLFNAKKSAYEDAKAVWEQDTSDQKALKAFESAKTALEKALKSISKKESNKNAGDLLCELYWSTFSDKYRSFINYLVKYTSAGFQEKMTTDNDVFFIGQYINGYANLGDPINFNKDGTVRQQGMADASFKVADEIGAEDRTRSYMLGFAEAFYGGCDWFIGRNITDKENPSSIRVNQFGGPSMPKDLDSWLHTRGNWVYVPGGSQQQYRSGGVESLPTNYTMLKPYLVLNSNDELSGSSVLNENGNVDRYEGTPYTSKESKKHQGDKYKYVYGAAARTGFSDWEKIRLQHVKRQIDGSTASESNRLYGKLEDGVGLQGLIVEYKRTNPEFSDCEFDSSWLSYSGTMANRIVQRVSFGKYNSYTDYLFDMSPDSIICVDDIVLAYSVETSKLDEDEMLKRRFPRYANTNNISLLLTKSDSDLSSINLNLSNEAFDELDSRRDSDETTNFEAVTDDSQEQIFSDSTDSSTKQVEDEGEDDDWYNKELGIDNSEQNQGEHQEQPSNPTPVTPQTSQQSSSHGWTEEDRNKIANSLVTAYLMGIKTANYDMYVHFSNPNLRSSLVSVMKELIIEEGY